MRDDLRYRVGRAAAWWWLVAALSLLCALVWPDLAFAQGHKSNTKYGIVQSSSGRGDVVPTGADLLSDLLAKPGRWHTAEPATGSSILRDLLDKPSRGPLSAEYEFDAAVKRRVTAGMAARAVARALPVVGSALAVVEFIEATGCKFNPQAVAIECAGDLEEGPESSGMFYCVVLAGVRKCATTPEGVRLIVVSFLQKQDTQSSLLIRQWKPSECMYAGEWTGTFNYLSCKYTERMDFEWDHTLPGHVWKNKPDGYSGSFQVSRGTETNKAWQCEFELDANGNCIERPSPDEWADRADESPDAKGKAPPVPPLLDEMGVEYETSPPFKVEGPSVYPGGRIVEQTNPDGSTTTVDRDWLIGYSPEGVGFPWVSWSPRDVTRNYAPSEAPAPYVPPDTGSGGPGGAPGGSVVVTGPPAEDIECGLPGFPPCKIDESGTPTADSVDPAVQAQGIFAALLACVTTPSSCLPELPSFSWAFSLPAGCSAIPTPAFSPWLTQVDVCPFQGVIHDLMSLLWVAAGLFGAVSLVYRDATGGQ